MGCTKPTLLAVRRRCKAGVSLALCLKLLLSTTDVAADAASEADLHAAWETSGDLLQWGIPLAGLGLSFLLDGDSEPLSFDLSAFAAAPADPATAPGINWPGPRLGKSPRHDFFVAFARMETLTYGLKFGVDAQRPNGGGQSFPSGHTAASFMGAEFIRKNYGAWWGVPAYLAAGWVGWTRVDSHNHYWRDVLGGAAIGIAANYDFDAIETRAGTLSFGPALIEPAAALWEQRDPLQDNPLADTRSSPAPGLRLEWRF